jgi:hypothetical protein
MIKYRVFLFLLTDERRPETLVCFIRLSNGYFRCNRLFSSCHHIPNLPDMPRAELIRQSREKKHPIQLHVSPYKQRILLGFNLYNLLR